MKTKSAKLTVKPPIEHFVELAHQGRRNCSSAGEQRARRLALCILENLPGLDDQAVSGLTEFLHYVQLSPESSRRLIGE